MNNLPDGAVTALTVTSEQIGGQLSPAVSARQLHEALGTRRDFTSWIKSQVRRGRLLEGRDWVLTTFGVNLSGGRPRHDYLLTTDAGKHIAMMSGSDRGFAIREHFLLCERQMVERANPSVHSLLSDPAALRTLLSEFAGKTLQADLKLAEMAPKAEFHDAVTAAVDCQPLQVAAKTLGIGPNTLFATLRQKKVLLPSNLPYQAQLDAGRFRVVEGSYKDRDGEQRLYTRTLVTGKGLTFLQSLLAHTQRPDLPTP